jgi:hypothetical protein
LSSSGSLIERDLESVTTLSVSSSENALAVQPAANGRNVSFALLERVGCGAKLRVLPKALATRTDAQLSIEWFVPRANSGMGRRATKFAAG